MSTAVAWIVGGSTQASHSGYGEAPTSLQVGKDPTKDHVGFECDPRIAHLYVVKSWGPRPRAGQPLQGGRPPICSVLHAKLLSVCLPRVCLDWAPVFIRCLDLGRPRLDLTSLISAVKIAGL